MSKIDILVRSIFTLGILSGFTIPVSAQITPATTGPGSTTVNPSTTTANTIDIQGGQKSSDNKNLFHSFGKFNVETGQFANFKPDAGIQNILGRVTDGASLINGGIQVNGGVINPPAVNLFLMNPAGIVFGKNASLDINGAFTATTAKAIDFNGKWFNAVGTNNYSELTGNPIGLAFPGSTPGSIFSTATLSNVQPGKSITLVGGTVISTGDIKTAGGNISIATVEGGKYVQIQSDGSILRLDLPVSAGNIAPEAKAFTALSLPRLLTNTGVDLAATGVKNENGVVTLVGNPAANALVPDLDKAKVDYQKARAAEEKAQAAEEKAREDYFKAFYAVDRNSDLIEKGIIDARNNAERVLDDSRRITYDLSISIKDIQKTFDTLSAPSVFGEPSLISAAISQGDTVSKQNRQIVSGDIIVKKLNTSALDFKGGSVYLDSSRAILIGDILTNRFNSKGDTYVSGELNSYGGKVVLNAQTEIVAGTISSSTSPLRDPNDKNPKVFLPTAGGDITLYTQTGDIIVDSINTTAASPISTLGIDTLKDRTVRGGNLTVNAKGLFRVLESILTPPFGVINIAHGGTSFVTGVDEKALEASQTYENVKFIKDFKFLDRESGVRMIMFTSELLNGAYGVVYTNSSGFYDFSRGRDGSNGSSITAVKPSTTNIDPNKNSGDGKTGTEVAKNTSGDNSEKQDPKDNSDTSSDSQASKPGDSEEEQQKKKKRKQKAKCSNNSSAIASAKLGTDPTRSGNSANSADEEFCPPTIDNGILQILIDRN